MKRIIGIVVFSALAGTAFAGDTFELNRITGKDIPQIARGMTVPVPTKQEFVLTAQELAAADCLTKVELVKIVHPEIAESALAELKEHCVASRINPVLQANAAAQSLEKELKRLGIAAKVSVLNIETLPPVPVLAVGFTSSSDYDKALPLFDKDASGRLSYKGIEVSTRVIKDIAKTPNLWKQASFKAADGTEITVDYTPMSIGMDKLVAEPVWVTVHSPQAGIREAMAVILNYYDNSNQVRVKDIHMVDLKGVGADTFKARAQSVVIADNDASAERAAGTGYLTNYRQEIEVIMDGKWLVDPVTGGHSFKFNMAGAGTPAVEKGAGVRGPEKAAVGKAASMCSVIGKNATAAFFAPGHSVKVSGNMMWHFFDENGDVIDSSTEYAYAYGYGSAIINFSRVPGGAKGCAVGPTDSGSIIID